MAKPQKPAFFLQERGTPTMDLPHLLQELQNLCSAEGKKSELRTEDKIPDSASPEAKLND